MSRFITGIEEGRLVIGSLDTLGSSRLTEVMAAAGLDVLLIDQMFCPTEWETVATMVRSARNYGMDTMVRIPGFPWLGKTDSRLVVDAVRALGVGATGVMASCATAEEVGQLLEVSKDWHRDIHIHAFSDDDFAAHAKEIEKDCIIMPMIESRSAMEQTEQVLAVPGLRYLSLGMTDISHMLGHPFEYEHPDVVAYVSSAVRRAKAHGVVIGANLGYAYSKSIEDMVARTGRMRELGLGFVWLQNDGYVIQWMYRSLIRSLNAGLSTA